MEPSSIGNVSRPNSAASVASGWIFLVCAKLRESWDGMRPETARKDVEAVVAMASIASEF